MAKEAEVKAAATKTAAVKAAKSKDSLVDEHIRRKMLNYDKNGMTGRKVELSKENLNRERLKEDK